MTTLANETAGINQPCPLSYPPARMGVPGAALTAPARGQPLSGGVDMPKGTCAVDGCGRPAEKRQWCGAHYQRWRKHGNLFAEQPVEVPRTPQERFWAKVDKADSCWLWTGSLDANGYGYFLYRGRVDRAHRVAWELLAGPIPYGLHIDHLCRNPQCCNPAHLEPVTPGENTRRGFGPSAVNARKTHCIRGHPFSHENTYVSPRGKRQCRVCMAIREARRSR